MLFVPRQVALAAAASSSTSQPRAAAAAMAREEPKKEKKSKTKTKTKSKTAAKETAAAAAAPDARAAVVASVASFLEAGGFPRTLAALQSEAYLEAGAWRSSPVNLEELVAKFLDSSNPTPLAAAVGSNEQEDGVAEDGGKKKKEKKTGAEAGESENKASEPSAQEKPSENVGGEAKEKKQKKKKKDDSSAVNAGSDEATETVKDDDQKPDGKKKKSKKQEKDDDVEARLEKAELAIKKKFDEAEKLNGNGHKSREEEPKRQNDDTEKNSGAVEKKKKKEKSATETSEKTDAGAAPAEADGAKGKSGAVETVKDDNEKKAKKKRKKSDPEENVQVDGKEVAGKDSVPKPDDESKSAMESEEGDSGKLSNENAVAGKKRKLEDVQGSNPTVIAKEDDAANQSLSNGFAEDKTKEDSNIKPSKRQKHSSEPKTVIAFQRVKLEDVKFADERLQDNSYWAKGGADTGYGAKAQEVLGQVRGSLTPGLFDLSRRPRRSAEPIGAGKSTCKPTRSSSRIQTTSDGLLSFPKMEVYNISIHTIFYGYYLISPSVGSKNQLFVVLRGKAESIMIVAVCAGFVTRKRNVLSREAWKNLGWAH